MDLDEIEAIGAAPLQPFLRQIEAIHTHDDLWDVLTYMFEWAVPSFFSMDTALGLRVRKNYTMFLASGGLILPDAGYYDIDVHGDEDDQNETLRLYIHTYM